MERVEERKGRNIVQKMATLFPDKAIQASSAIFPWGVYSLMSDVVSGRVETASVLLERLALAKQLQTTSRK